MPTKAFVFLFLSVPLLLWAQLRPTGMLAGGYTIPIHPDYPSIERHAWLFAAGVSQAVDGRQAWHHLFRDPRLSYQLIYHDPGNPEVMGQAITLALWLDLQAFGRERWQGRYCIGKGPSVMTRPQSLRHNPDNIAYGGYLTDLTALGFYLRRRMNDHFALDLGLYAWHYSSAQVAVPNVGINTLSLALGVQGLPRGSNEKAFTPAKVTRRGIRAAIRLGLGLAGRKLDEGPMYSIYTVMPYLTWQPNAKFRLSGGGKFFYHDGLYEFFQTQDFGEDNHRAMASGAIAWLGGEWLLGHLGINLKLGPYLKAPVLMPYTLYTEMGLQYYWHDLQQRDGWQPFVGLSVHAHSGQADWGELSLGIAF
jgi:hypothetical protein